MIRIAGLVSLELAEAFGPLAFEGLEDLDGTVDEDEEGVDCGSGGLMRLLTGRQRVA